MSLDSDYTLFAVKDISLKSCGLALHTARKAMYIWRISMALVIFAC